MENQGKGQGKAHNESTCSDFQHKIISCNLARELRTVYYGRVERGEQENAYVNYDSDKLCLGAERIGEEDSCL